MSNAIDLIVSKKAQTELEKLYKDLGLVHEEIVKINQTGIKFNNSASPKNLTELVKVQKEYTKTAKQMEQASIRESNARNALNKQRDREIQKLQASKNMYNQVQNRMNALQNEYKNLAVKKELNITLTSNEEQRYALLQAKIQTYDKTLKAVDATMGKYTRNVGNYASGFNPLNNSIAQLTREAPAFANSINTGFMAISNNLPIFFDAMQGIIAQNKELQAQGKPTTSVLKQLAMGFFSFQTLLSVGVTLLTIYGGKIIESISNSKNKKAALEAEKKALEEKTRAEKQAQEQQIKYANDEISKSKLLLSTANNLRLSYSQRIEAVKELQKRYPDYLGKLSEEEILAGKTAEMEYKLNDALMKRAMFLALQDKITDVTKKLVSNEIEYANALNKAKDMTDLYDESIQEQTKTKTKLRLVTDEETESLNYLEQEEKQYQETLKKSKVAKLGANDAKRQGNISALKELEILFKLLKIYEPYNFAVNEDKETKKKQKKALDDIIASEYELQKAILERKKAELQSQYTNTNLFLDTRIEALKELEKTEEALINLTYFHSLELEKKKKEDKIREFKEALEDNLISQEKYNENIKQIELQSSYDIEIINVDLGKKLNDLAQKNLESKKQLEKEKADFITKNEEQISNKQKNIYKEESDNEKKKLKERQLAFIDYINLAKKELDIKKIQEISNAKSVEEIEYIREKYAQLNSELDRLLEKDSPFAKNLKWLEEFKKSFQDDFISNSGFDKLFFIIENFDKLKNSGVDTALAISEAFQQAYNLISEASQNNLDAEYSRLEQQKEISLQFAGDSASAKQEIEEQYETRKREIQRREAELQKRLAIFNIAINTAQGIISALAMTPPNVPLSIAIGVIGAVQAGIVASKQIPQFWKGTDNAPEGYAWTQEKGAEIITDKKGKVKTYGSEKGAKLTYLEKGDKVFTAEKTKGYLNGVLKNIGISPLGSYANIDKTQNATDFTNLENKISNLASAIKNQDKTTITVYKDKTFTRVGGKELQNARLEIRPRKYTNG